MAWALAYLGSLAFAAFCLWLYRQRVPVDELRDLWAKVRALGADAKRWDAAASFIDAEKVKRGLTRGT